MAHTSAKPAPAAEGGNASLSTALHDLQSAEGPASQKPDSIELAAYKLGSVAKQESPSDPSAAAPHAVNGPPSSNDGNFDSMMANIPSTSPQPSSPSLSRTTTLVGDQEPDQEPDLEAQQLCGIARMQRIQAFASKNIKKMTLKGTVKTAFGVLMCFGTLYAAFRSGCEVAQAVDGEVWV